MSILFLDEGPFFINESIVIAFRDVRMCDTLCNYFWLTINVIEIRLAKDDVPLIAVIIMWRCVMMHVDVWRQVDYRYGQAASL